jgi:hypothetical protein
MERRAILLSLVILAVFGWWVLRPEPASIPASLETSLGVGGPEPGAMARQGDQPTSIEPERPTEVLVSPSSSDPLDRQRRRLLDTSVSLAARRDAARTSGAPEPTLQAIDAHLARVQQQLATLDVTIAGAVVAEGASQAVPAAAR